MPTKLAIVSTHIIQYLSPIYRQIARENRIDLRVVYYSDIGGRAYRDVGFDQEVKWDVDLREGFESVVLHPGAPLLGGGALGVDSPRLTEALDDWQPDAVLIYGYVPRLVWRARRWAVRNGKAILYLSDSTPVGYRRAWWKRLVKQVFVRWFLRPVDVFLAIGDRNEAYLRHYGADPARIVRCPYGLDLERFDAALGQVGPDARPGVRERYAIPSDAFVVVFSGKMVPRKRPGDVLEAVARLAREGVEAHALMMGSGEMLDGLKARAEALGVSDRVHWAGFVNQSEIPLLYAACDALAMPSEREAYGQVVPEAAACGLPVIVSDRLGCVGPTDSARDGENAIVHRCGDVAALAEALRRLAGNPGERERMARRSREIAATQDVKVAARAIVSAVLKDCGR